MRSSMSALSNRRRPALAALAVGLVVLLGACGDDNGTDPNGLRFGQIGRVSLSLEIPLLGGGVREQMIVWSSQGPFTLAESISYEGEVGDRTVVRERRNPEHLAGRYAEWITQVNEVQGVQLFGFVDPDLQPECTSPPNRITLEIHDEVRDETRTWVRCTPFSLSSLEPRGAGPDLPASRVVLAAQFLRDATIGADYTSAYVGSIPFATIAKGEDSEALLTSSFTITDTASWRSFWQQHTGSAAEPPSVDFGKDLVLVGAVGVRQEAGDSVEIRRIQPSGPGLGSAAELVELVPGNFCAPVARSHVPFHVVRAPRVQVPQPVRFSTPALVEPVPCGA